MLSSYGCPGYLVIFWHGCVVSDFDLCYLGTRDIAMQSALVIDAKALFDSIRAEVPQLQGDKRTKIEIMIIKQKIDEIGSKLRWISSETQLADGVTKMAARQLLADRIRTHLLSLQSDKTFQAAKRKTQAERQASARRNAIGRMVHKGSLGYIVLTNQLVPARGEDSTHDYFFDITSTFVIITFSISILQCFQRMTWFSRSSTGSSGTPSALSQSTSTQTEPNDEILKTRKHMKPQHHRIDMLTQQVHDKDEKITELQEWIDYYQGDLASTPLWVSRADCNSLQNANPAGIWRLILCSHCIHHLQQHRSLTLRHWQHSLLLHRCEFGATNLSITSMCQVSTTCGSRTHSELDCAAITFGFLVRDMPRGNRALEHYK